MEREFLEQIQFVFQGEVIPIVLSESNAIKFVVKTIVMSDGSPSCQKARLTRGTKVIVTPSVSKKIQTTQDKPEGFFLYIWNFSSNFHSFGKQKQCCFFKNEIKQHNLNQNLFLSLATKKAGLSLSTIGSYLTTMLLCSGDNQSPFRPG